jgi:hypothetical protein
MPILIFARVLQGRGGGLAPSAQALLAGTFSVADHGESFTLCGMVGVVAPAIAPTLGRITNLDEAGDREEINLILGDDIPVLLGDVG